LQLFLQVELFLINSKYNQTNLFLTYHFWKRHYDRQFINIFRKPLIYLESDNTELLGLETPVVLLCWDRMDPNKPLPRADQDAVVKCVLLTRDMAMEALYSARKIELTRLNSPFRRITQKITHKLTRIY
jgi:hypothetical protein